MKFAFALLLASSVTVAAQQGHYDFADETIELSSFTVSASSNGFDPRNRGGHSSGSPVRLIKRADTVTLTLTISSDHKKPDERIKALQEALRLLREKAAQKKDVFVRTGYIELPLATGYRLFSSAKTSDEVSSFDVTFVAKLAATDTFFERTAYLNRFIDEVQFGRDIKALYVSTGIALVDPDQYRGEILRQIGEDYRKIKEIFGPAIEVDIKGLDQRVQVRQLNDTNLELSLPYQMILRTKS